MANEFYLPVAQTDTSGWSNLSNFLERQNIRRAEDERRRLAGEAFGDYYNAGDEGLPGLAGIMPPEAAQQPFDETGAEQSSPEDTFDLTHDHPEAFDIGHIMDPENAQNERLVLDSIGITPEKHDEVIGFADKFKSASDDELGSLIKDRVKTIVDRGGDASDTASLMALPPSEARSAVNAIRTIAKRDAIRRIAINNPEMAYKIMSDEQATRRAELAEKKQQSIMEHFARADEMKSWSKPIVQESSDGSGKLVMISRNALTGEVREDPLDARFQPRPVHVGGGSASYDPNAPLTDDEKQIRDAIIEGNQSPLTVSGRSPSNLKIMADVRRKTNGDYDAKDYFAQKVMKTKMASGDMGKAVRSLNVAQTHLDALDEAADAIGGDVNSQSFRKASQMLAKEFGAKEIPSFDVAKQIVADEVVKAIVGGQNSDADRQHMQEVFQRAQTTEQLKAAVNEARILIGGQLKGMRQQIKGAGLGDDYFNKFLDKRNIESSGGSTGARKKYNPATGKIE